MNNLSTKSESYAKKAKFLLVGLFRTAVDNDLIPKSPANSLQLPVTAPPNERRALTKRERLLFLNAAEQLGQPGLFFLIMYYEGLRPSEVCRIRHEDFEGEGDQRVLHVRGSKTKASTRTLPVSALLDIPEGSGPLFISGSGRPPSKTVLANWWRKVTRKMEEISGTPTAKDLTAYCLRHDFCTRCQEGGLDIDITRRMMGHSSIEVTSRSYTHPSDAAIETARKVINRGSTVPQGVTQDR